MLFEKRVVQKLFKKLCAQSQCTFPQHRQLLNAPKEPGVYVIRKGRVVLHVGRTPRGKGGLHQRLKNHLHGSSSFTREYLNGMGANLRTGHTYQYLLVRNPRQRALLEAYAVATLCPKHIGVG